MNFNELLNKYDMTVTEFSQLYSIPWRTVYAWSTGKRKPADWLLTLLDESEMLRRSCSHEQANKLD